MAPLVRVHLLPTLIESRELVGGTAVIIDVLRASSTMIQALHSGVRRILPCGSLEEAHGLASGIPREERLLGGERKGRLIQGFDLDNSPRAYTPDRVAGKTLIFTTTNGTQALRRAQSAARIYVGAFVNLQALVNRLQQCDENVHLICAGTDGRLTAEDILFAGLAADRLQKAAGADSARTDVSTEMAIAFAREHGGTPAAIRRTLDESVGGRNLLELGLSADIEFAARFDTLPLVPEWDASRSELRQAPPPSNRG